MAVMPEIPEIPETGGRGAAGAPGGLHDPDVALYARMRWNVPLSAEHADLLLDRMSLGPGQAIADLGCGWGELLMRAVARAGPGAAGTGIDIDEPPAVTDVSASLEVLPWAREEAARRRLDVQFIQADVSAWPGMADRVLCLGASHAYRGTTAALRALAGHVPLGGRLLYGDCFWERPPSPEAVGLFGEETMPLPGLMEACRAEGWRVIHLSTASQLEWDDYESSFRAGRQEWLLASPGHPRAAQIRDWIDARERQYLTVYREVLGFAYLVLAH
jgi:SAM-dependent methyltransferase